MGGYIVKRFGLMVPTLFGIMLVNFVFVQITPGGPIEQLIAEAAGTDTSIAARLGTEGDVDQGMTPNEEVNRYRGAEALNPELIAELEREFGFDRPLSERFFSMLGRYIRLDFGDSLFRGNSVIGLIRERLPVSITLGLWATLLTYLVSIPLGIVKAVRAGTPFDSWSSGMILIGYAIPSFVVATLLITLFAGGSVLQWFPLRGLIGEGWQNWPLWRQAASYAWHIALPVTSLVVGNFAFMTMLTKNCFLDQLSQHYVLTARAKGLTERRVLIRHVFRNAMLIVLSGLPSALISMLFTGILIIEVIFSLDGLGLLGFEAALTRDYPVLFGTLYITALLGVLLRLVSDLTYVVIDPRIDFRGRDA